MKYYTIQNNTLLTAENEKALNRFYDKSFDNSCLKSIISEL